MQLKVLGSSGSRAPGFHASCLVLEMVQERLLNNRVWPDFPQIPSRENPVLEYCPLPDQGPVMIAGLKV